MKKKWEVPEIVDLDAEKTNNTSTTGIYNDGSRYVATSTMLS